MQELYHKMREYIHYYKNEINLCDIKNSKIMLFLCEAIELMLRISKRNTNVIDMIPIVENHITLV